jgi:hypothetical protein
VPRLQGREFDLHRRAVQAFTADLRCEQPTPGLCSSRAWWRCSGSSG